MVVLDSNSVMSANSGNQYLSPDYLPPLPSTVSLTLISYFNNFYFFI